MEGTPWLQLCRDKKKTAQRAAAKVGLKKQKRHPAGCRFDVGMDDYILNRRAMKWKNAWNGITIHEIAGLFFTESLKSHIEQR